MTDSICAKPKILLLSFLIFLVIPLAAEGDEPSGHEETLGLMRGQSLFFGLIEGTFESKACADCHNTVEIDTFNWNPSAYEIAAAYRDRSPEEFRRAVLEPSGRTMSEMHRTFNLGESDVEMIKLFLDDLEEKGLEKKKPVVNKIFLFILLGVVLTWIVLDVLFIKKVRKRMILLLLFAVALGWQIKLMYEAGTALGRQQGYEPDQPVNAAPSSVWPLQSSSRPLQVSVPGSSFATQLRSPSWQKYSSPTHTVSWSATRYGLQLLKTCSRPILTSRSSRVAPARSGSLRRAVSVSSTSSRDGGTS